VFGLAESDLNPTNSIQNYAWTGEAEKLFMAWPMHAKFVKVLRNMRGMTYGLWMLDTVPCCWEHIQDKARLVDTITPRGRGIEVGVDLTGPTPPTEKLPAGAGLPGKVQTYSSRKSSTREQPAGNLHDELAVEDWYSVWDLCYSLGMPINDNRSARQDIAAFIRRLFSEAEVRKDQADAWMAVANACQKSGMVQRKDETCRQAVLHYIAELQSPVDHKSLDHKSLQEQAEAWEAVVDTCCELGLEWDNNETGLQSVQRFIRDAVAARKVAASDCGFVMKHRGENWVMVIKRLRQLLVSVEREHGRAKG